jgi:hypothetical protein
MCYRDGEGVSRDTAEASKWFHKAAEQGSGTAQKHLREMPASQGPEPQEDAGKEVPLPAGARALAVSVGGGDWAASMYNPTLKNVACYAMTDRIIITFDVDTAKWEKRIENWMFPILVRLFDKNGQYLTHFETGEKFSAKPKTFEGYQRFYKQSGMPRNVHKPVLLKAKGNRLEYTVSTRDIQFTEQVEIGFLEIAGPAQ